MNTPNKNKFALKTWILKQKQRPALLEMNRKKLTNPVQPEYWTHP